MSGLVALIATVTLIFQVPEAMPRKLYDLTECSDVVHNFTSCQGFIQGLQSEPGSDCCCGIHMLNNVAKQGDDEVERICRCIEEIAATDDPPFIAQNIEALPGFCHTHLSFPISVSMDCSNLLLNEKEKDRRRLGDISLTGQLLF